MLRPCQAQGGLNLLRSTSGCDTHTTGPNVVSLLVLAYFDVKEYKVNSIKHG